MRRFAETVTTPVETYVRSIEVDVQGRLSVNTDKLLTLVAVYEDGTTITYERTA